LAYSQTSSLRNGYKLSLAIIFIVLLNISCADKINNPTEAKISTIGIGEDEITVVVVSGTSYEMGYQLGKALKDEIKSCMTGFIEYAQKGEKTSRYSADTPGRYDDATLDNAWLSVSPYLTERFIEEMNGLAEGSELPIELLKRAHMIPVVGDYACSGVSVWGKASNDGHLYQIRNLDFTMVAGLQDYPVIVVYLPDEGIAHASATFAGYIAAHTGINAKGIVLSEKGASPGSEYPFDLDGTHFSTLFRDLLYEANNLDEALNMIETTKLIKRYRLYVGDGKNESMGAAKILVSSPDSVKLTIWKDNDANDEVAPNIKENICYYTMENDITYNYLSDNYGSFDASKMIELSKLVATKSGNLENVVYDATNLEMWVSYAHGDEVASSRSYVHLDLKQYFNND